MDINPTDLKTSEHMIIWSQSDFQQNPVETKSFKCSFCKRGFSNAQALGGHMNIHRKDRAKLKELSLDLDVTVDRKHSPPPDSSAGKILTPENDESPIDIVEEKNPGRGLPLFAEAAAVNVDDGGGEEAERCRFEKDVEGRKVVELDYCELDLELRLGPEPNHAKSNP